MVKIEAVVCQKNGSVKVRMVCVTCSYCQEIDLSEFVTLSFPMSEKEAGNYVKVIMKYLEKKVVVCDGCGTLSHIAPNDRGKLARELREALLSKK
jgi:hypothetical protein